MPVNVNQQTIVFLACVVTGIFSGIIFDVLSITAKKLRFKKSAVFVQDILIWCIILAFFFSIIYKINGAVLRWYIFIGAIFGGLFYILVPRIYTVKTVSFVINLAGKVICRVLKILIFPIRKFVRLFAPLKKYVQIVRKKKDNFVQKNVAKIRRIKILLKKV